MKLKSRLITAFLIMIAMPIILLIISASTIFHYQVNSIHESYDIEADNLQLITNPILILNRLTRGVFNEIKLSALKFPEKFEDEEFITKLNEELSNKYSFITVRKNGEYIYTGNEDKLKLISNSLPQFGVYNASIEGGIYLGGKNPFLVKSQDFYFSDGWEGTIFILTDLNILVPQLKAVAIQGVMAFILILCFTASALIYWIYRGMIKPLNVLRIATNQMKEGDLNYSVYSETEDEIGQLCDDFEEMRIRLKELIEYRLQYEEDIKELISNISHDLKTPLTTIKGYTEGLIDGVADTKEKQDKHLKTIYMKANDMSVLVDELAFYTKIDCNSVPYAFANINVNEYFMDCIEDLRLELEVKNIVVDFHNKTDNKIQVVADPEQLKRVINNITGNAVKYMDNKKLQLKIDIDISDIGEYVQIDIKDNGVGISSVDLPYIFDRFFRADTSRNTRKGGSGLGLAISKKIIFDHSGNIWVNSEEGKGTTISFTLKKVGG